ncbi:hypothetical protein C0058_27220 [Pseudomonas sp. NC02]|nr:hypothetical protein C0058_27220 [Pseudomonas sp. NC02]
MSEKDYNKKYPDFFCNDRHSVARELAPAGVRSAPVFVAATHPCGSKLPRHSGRAKKSPEPVGASSRMRPRLQQVSEHHPGAEPPG